MDINDNRTEFQAKLNAFIADVNAMIQDDWSQRKMTFSAPKVFVGGGRKFIRLVYVDGCGCGPSAYCFIDSTNGDILKSASWKAPAKHARGNIFDPNPLAAVTVYGAKYLK